MTIAAGVTMEFFILVVGSNVSILKFNLFLQCKALVYNKSASLHPELLTHTKG